MKSLRSACCCITNGALWLLLSEIREKGGRLDLSSLWQSSHFLEDKQDQRDADSETNDRG
ncbi:hypothetical protein DI388_13565 [Escherichia coli]|nr:hypothetical protein DI388_13565 [Escherichia coli]